MQQIHLYYTKLLRKALNRSWKDHICNDVLYNNPKKASEKIKERSLKLAGHCVRHPEITANFDLLWTPKYGSRGRGRPKFSYIDQLKRDTVSTMSMN